MGITDPKEIEIFRAIIAAAGFAEGHLAMEKGELRVEELSSSTESFEDLVNSAGKIKEPCLDFQFKSTTSHSVPEYQGHGDVPAPGGGLSSLLSKWNAVCPEELKMIMERDDMARFMMEEPLAYETHSAMVNTVMDKVKGHARPMLKQGFLGRCQYRFTKESPEGLRNGVVALARFAEYSGVGSAVARGCGAVKVEWGRRGNGKDIHGEKDGESWA